MVHMLFNAYLIAGGERDSYEKGWHKVLMIFCWFRRKLKSLNLGNPLCGFSQKFGLYYSDVNYCLRLTSPCFLKMFYKENQMFIINNEK